MIGLMGETRVYPRCFRFVFLGDLANQREWLQNAFRVMLKTQDVFFLLKNVFFWL